MQPTSHLPAPLFTPGVRLTRPDPGSVSHRWIGHAQPELSPRIWKSGSDKKPAEPSRMYCRSPKTAATAPTMIRSET